jgi:UDP-N-acetylmuramoylalanine--D-glutamate ligase
VNFENSNVLVIGMKRSGQGAAELLLKHGARVRFMDESEPGPQESEFLQKHGLTVVKQSIENLGDEQVVVVSPGVPIDLPLLNEVRMRGVPVIGEVELSSYFLKGPVIGITGSNGKTTTTALVGHILRESGVDCQVGGNIGKAATGMVETSDEKRWNVLEVSSFQLEAISHFRAQIAACLNVTPDHLDRHHTLERYVNAKARLFETQMNRDCAVFNYDDEICRQFAARTKAEIFWFSVRQKVPAGVCLTGDELMWNGKAFTSRKQIRLRGLHNVENVAAATLMAGLAGVALEFLGEAVRSFPGVEHRIEFVRSFDGVEYYNDSKATNVDAALKAIDAFSGSLWIILGGKDKNSDYRPLCEPLRAKAEGALLIGQAADKIGGVLEGCVPLVPCGTLADAVSYAREHAEAGDVVLLAPACASFDQFENFEHRGKTFKQLVAQLF